MTLLYSFALYFFESMFAIFVADRGEFRFQGQGLLLAYVGFLVTGSRRRVGFG